MSDIDCLVIGAGVVGLAVARELALAGREIVIAEATEGIGTQPRRAIRGHPCRDLAISRPAAEGPRLRHGP